jgi:hypothetical protein
MLRLWITGPVKMSSAALMKLLGVRKGILTEF